MRSRPDVRSALCLRVSRLTKTQRRLMRRSERRAAQRSGPEAQDGCPDDTMDACLQQDLGTLPEEEDTPPEELHDPSPSALNGMFLTSSAHITHACGIGLHCGCFQSLSSKPPPAPYHASVVAA